MSNPLTNAAAGASAGAAVGSVIPGIGNALGAGIGAAGSLLYDGAKALFNPNSEKASSPSDLLSGDYVNLGKLGNKKQTRAMESEARLAALQQYYARQNNQQDFQNQLYMTRAAASLEAAGRRDAGLSTAGDFNGESVSSPSINSPSLPSPPTVDDTPSSLDSANFLKDVSALISTLKVNDSAVRKNDSETDLNEIDKLTRFDENLAELDRLHAENKISKVEYKRRKTALDYERSTLSDRIKQTEEERKQSELKTTNQDLQNRFQETQNEIAKVSLSYNKEQLKQAKFITEHQLERFKADMAEVASRIKANNASASASFAAAASSKAQAYLLETQGKLEAAKVPNADKLAKNIWLSAECQTAIAYNNKLISDAAAAHAHNQQEYHESPLGEAMDWLTEPIRGVLAPLAGAAASIVK